MLIPKKVKFRKMHKGRGRNRRQATARVDVNFGSYGLRALSSSWVSSRQIEAARRVLTRFIRRGGRVWIRVFPDKPVTIKGSEVPMGGGKGAVDHYVVSVKPGMVLFEMDGISEAEAREAMRLAGFKLSVRTRFATKEIL